MSTSRVPSTNSRTILGMLGANTQPLPLSVAPPTPVVSHSLPFAPPVLNPNHPDDEPLLPANDSPRSNMSRSPSLNGNQRTVLNEQQQLAIELVDEPNDATIYSISLSADETQKYLQAPRDQHAGIHGLQLLEGVNKEQLDASKAKTDFNSIGGVHMRDDKHPEVYYSPRLGPQPAPSAHLSSHARMQFSRQLAKDENRLTLTALPAPIF